MRFIALIISIPLILLGAHGLYAYFQGLDAIFGMLSGNADKLFFSITVPQEAAEFVSWMSLRGIQSFVIPGVFLAVGLFIGRYALNK